jgi:lipopolysaccharide transport system ATP-binding protein
MSETVIAVENLSKRYLIEHSPGAKGYKRYTALRDVIGEGVRNFARRALAAGCGRQAFRARETEEFWALKDISFEVKQGEVLGIIGRNGAGKSTLLKILSRITEPTAGCVTLRGRVASLLEVGTGFHPELTGRENIYLNGAILGMSRVEIRKKFDEIVAFAETEKFLDTPVKRYSSGMYVRLAFAVAAHLEPEILVVDEVLAVGDAQFQQKCLGKMGDVARESRTVLFVSHNMGAIRTLTRRCILLDGGRLVASGDTDSVIQKYLSRLLDAKAIALRSKDLEVFRRWRREDPPARIAGIEIEGSRTDEMDILAQIPFGSKLIFRVLLDVYQTIRAADLGILIINSSGQKVTELVCSDYDQTFLCEPGKYTVKVSVNDLPLAPGRYFVQVWVIPMLGIDRACDSIYDYPLFSIIKEGHIDHYPTPIAWGAVHCQAVKWDISHGNEGT